jgi:hypothetical protein
MVEQRYLAVRVVLNSGAKHRPPLAHAPCDGRPQSALADKTLGPAPHQIVPEIEARIVSLRRPRPGWGPRTILNLLRRELEQVCRRGSRSTTIWCVTVSSTPSRAGVGGRTTSGESGLVPWNCDTMCTITYIAIAALPLYSSVLDDPRYILGAGTDAQVRLGAFLEFIVVIANIGTAVVLYPIVKRQNQVVALGYVATRIVESMIIAVGIFSLLSIVTLRQDLAGSGADSASLVTAGRSLVALHDWTFLFGPGMLAGLGNGILLGYLLYRSGLVPRRLAMLGLIGGPAWPNSWPDRAV